MYSMLLMTALATGPDVPQFNGYFRDLFSGCHGCSGCQGRTAGSVSATCQGCQGHLFSGDRLRSFFSLGGGSCQGTCHGSCYGSCTGRTSGTGCCGGTYAATYSCMGSSCFGNSMPYAYDGGMPYGPALNPAPLPRGGYDPPYAPTSPAGPPGEVNDRPGSSFRPTLPPPPGLTPRATITVRLPADARLFAEGQALAHTNGEKTFVSPLLPTGQEFTYTFRAEYVRNGEKLTREKPITVKAGGSYTVEFSEDKASKPTEAPRVMPANEPVVYAKTTSNTNPLAAMTGGKDPALAETPTDTTRAKITVKLPAGATLFVDGRKNEKTELTREFVTPPLVAGKEYTYSMMATKPGVNASQPDMVTHKIAFRAGENVTVDFTAIPDTSRAGK